MVLTYLIISLIVNSMCLRTSEISLEPCEVQPSNKSRYSAPNRHSAPKEFLLSFSKAIWLKGQSWLSLLEIQASQCWGWQGSSIWSSAARGQHCLSCVRRLLLTAANTGSETDEVCTELCVIIERLCSALLKQECCCVAVWQRLP